jgi:hypothetical protein
MAINNFQVGRKTYGFMMNQVDGHYQNSIRKGLTDLDRKSVV